MSRRVIVWVLAVLVLVGTFARAEDKADPVAGYKTFLASLPKDDPASITKAIDQYRAVIVPLDMDRRVRAFLEFLDFHNEVCSGLAQTLWDRVTPLTKTEKMDSLVDQFWHSDEVRGLRNYGLELFSDGMGGFYVRGIPEHIPGVFSPFLSRPIREFLELRLSELRERYESDGGLTISFASLAQRVANWDRYIRNYGDSPMRAEALTLRATYLLNLLFGMDNSPLDPATKDLSNNIRVVYRDFMRAHPETYATRFVRAQYDYLKKEGFFRKGFDGDTRQVPARRYAEVKASLAELIPLSQYPVDVDRSYKSLEERAN